MNGSSGENVNIIGAGLAGLSAALTLAGKGMSCRLISLQPSERSQSVMAEGGINAALDTMGEGDSTKEHFEDTMRGGAYLADPEAVRGLTENAPDIVRWLFKLGVPFAMNDGDILLRNFGGQKKKRTAFAKSSTGKVIMNALTDEVRKWEAKGLVVRYPHHEALEPLIKDGICKGVFVRDTFTDEISFFEGAVIMATGGLNGLFEGHTTGSTANSGDFAAACFAKGVNAANLEMIQYHPTTAHIPGKRLLISEAARGEGGRLFIMKHSRPWYFMEELCPEQGNLAPRDVISKTMTEVTAAEDTEGSAFLDLTGLSGDIWKNRLSDMRDELREFLDIDPATEPIPVSPGIHFFMGGIKVDIKHRTNVTGLYAAGECDSQYHGANRLGGNSMLGAIYGGRVAAETLAEEASMLLSNSAGDTSPDPRTHKYTNDKAPDISNKTECRNDASQDEEMPDTSEIRPATADRISDTLSRSMGVLRNGAELETALKDLAGLKKECTPRELRRIMLAEAMLTAAYERKESCGAHVRTD